MGFGGSLWLQMKGPGQAGGCLLCGIRLLSGEYRNGNKVETFIPENLKILRYKGLGNHKG